MRVNDIVTRERLTAAHYLANRWVMNQVAMRSHDAKSKALDFGCRRSELPMMLANAKYQVFALDRDPLLGDLQDDVARKYKIQRNWICVPWTGLGDLPFECCTFELITAIWAVQHNDIHRQEQLILEFARCLKVGGEALIVSSYAPGGIRLDANRKDPQVVVGDAELDGFANSSGLEMTVREHFWYDHGTVNGDWCEPERAVAVAYALRKTHKETGPADCSGACCTASS